MFTREQEHKAHWILNRFSPGELQSRVGVDTPVKSGRKPHSQISIRTKLVPASRIPASTIYKFQQHTYTPRERSIKKLAAFYDRYQYHKLRAGGANYEDARRYARWTPDELGKIFGDYRRWVKQIQKNYETQNVRVKKTELQHGMAHSGHRYSDWESVAMISGLKRPRVRSRRSKRSRQYEH